MYNTKRGIASYKNTRVTTASQSKLVVMLYDEAIKQLKIAVEILESPTRKVSNIAEVNSCLNKVLDIIGELTASLNFEQGGDLAKNLFNLYNFFSSEIINANVSKEVQNLGEVIRLFTELREAWNVVDSNFARDSNAFNNVGV